MFLALFKNSKSLHLSFKFSKYLISTMPPVSSEILKDKVNNFIKSSDVFIFSKSFCPFCKKLKQLFMSLKIPYNSCELDQLDDGSEIQNFLKDLTSQNTVPNVFIKGKHAGGSSEVESLYMSDKIWKLINYTPHNFDYDVVVIGGGSGGLAASKEAVKYFDKVAVLDFISPTPKGTVWGLGGTCVNVGCIPKKLMHQSALLGESNHDFSFFGWTPSNHKHNWNVLVENINNYIRSINFKYRVELRDKKVNYLNAKARFLDENTIETVDKKGKKTKITSNYFIIAAGCRPVYPDIPGAKELGITSDDVFTLPESPGKTLLIGASYISLETAGFLHTLGYDVSVMVRSILLRGFDRDMSEKVGEHMNTLGIKFIRPAVPIKLENDDSKEDLIKVTYEKDGEVLFDHFKTVIFAVGRKPLNELDLDKANIKYNPKNFRIYVNEKEETSNPKIFALGDIADGKPELTPLAIQAGKLLSRRLGTFFTELCDYNNIPTTVFTPLEYGAVGLSEENAIEQFGEEDIDVYHTMFKPLEWAIVQGRPEHACYGKVIVVKSQNEKVVGLHVLSPNAGEITQGYAVAMKCGMTKGNLDETVGIHPTISEIFTVLDITKRSKKSVEKSAC